ncbi:MAG: SRPBCC family protein [Thermoanaerobaculum sp.]|nr:SRPBCC family protein [Thermoanaerobaculum sp.]MDW7967519.1 SRPBCC family protein [Thermoanaerobaculum sp.]
MLQPRVHQLLFQQLIPAPLEVVWQFFATPRNLNLLTPPFLHFSIVQGAEEPMYPGQLIRYRLRLAPGIWASWVTEIAHLEEGRYFVDEQRLGPYRFWYHEHRFQPVAEGVAMTDRVSYALPWGWLGEVAHALWVRRQLVAIFHYRAQQIQRLFPGGA